MNSLLQLGVEFQMSTITENQKADCNEVEIYQNKWYLFWRRVQDIFLSLIAMIVLFPFLLITAIVICLDDPHGGPIFSQIRCGKNGKLFKCYKFRSMCVNAEEKLEGLLDQNEMSGPAFKIKDDPRITRVGKFIRKTSIDELPQLVNVLLGDMSIVGPRPPLLREVEMYNSHQWKRLMVKPGLTCYWQIQPNRNTISFDDWVEMDLKYIQERSFLVDWKIILHTFITILYGWGQ